MRRSAVVALKARPKTVSTELSSNRGLPEKFQELGKDAFAIPPYPGKKAIHNWRFYIKPGKAVTGPPVGQEFSKLGLKPMDFCKAFNDKTKPVFKDDVELICRIQVYHDLTYSWRIEPPPTAWFILRAVKKKRRETGPVKDKGGFACYITLEMCYEIAKYKQINWMKPDYPPIETRARNVAGQARRMGIAVVGVDAPNSPVKGMTPAQYDKQAAEHRAEQWKAWEKFKADELERAPLNERVHRPDFVKMDESTLRKAAADMTLLSAIYDASKPSTKFARAGARQAAFTALSEAGIRFETAEEATQFTSNWRRAGRPEQASEETPFWTREAMRGGQV